MIIVAHGDFDFYKDSPVTPKPTTDSLMEIVKVENGKYSSIIVPNVKRIRDSLKISPKEFRKRAQVIESDLLRQKKMAGAGSAYIFKKDKSDKWIFHQRIEADDRKIDAYFGYDIDVSDSIIVIGAVGDKIDGKSVSDYYSYFAGAAYIFKLNKAGKWIQTAKLTAPKRERDKFGFSVGVYKKTVVIGSRFEAEDANE